MLLTSYSYYVALSYLCFKFSPAHKHNYGFHSITNQVYDQQNILKSRVDRIYDVSPNDNYFQKLRTIIISQLYHQMLQ